MNANPQTGPPTNVTPAPDPALPTERRISYLTLLFGLTAAIATAIFARNLIWSLGLAIGAVLAWLNFRWLRRGLDALVASSVSQSDIARPRVTIGAYLRALFRYALLALIAYVIFVFLGISLASMVVGMCSLAAAAIAASVYELWHPGT